MVGLTLAGLRCHMPQLAVERTLEDELPAFVGGLKGLNAQARCVLERRGISPVLAGATILVVIAWATHLVQLTVLHLLQRSGDAPADRM